MSILAVVVAKAQDSVKVDPKHYKVLFNNEYVRILDVRQKPGEKAPMHSHPKHVIYSLTRATIKFTSSDGKNEHGYNQRGPSGLAQGRDAHGGEYR